MAVVCSLLDAKKLTKTSADLIFTKAKAKGAKKMSFTEFKMVRRRGRGRLALLLDRRGWPPSVLLRADWRSVLTCLCLCVVLCQIAVPLMAQAKGVDEAIIYQHIAGVRQQSIIPPGDLAMSTQGPDHHGGACMRLWLCRKSRPAPA